MTHHDPWPWYRRLGERPVHLDHRTGCWVVARSDDVAAVLASTGAAVRPVDAPVPPHLERTLAGEFVSGMMRLRDGHGHRPLRTALELVLTSVAPARLDAALGRAAALLDGSTVGFDDDELLAAWVDRFPAAAIASLFDAPDRSLDALVTAAIALARACAPGASISTVPAAIDAVAVVETCWPEMSAAPVVADLAARLPSPAPDLVRANVVGCLVQAVDACAGAMTSVLERRLAGPDDWRVLTDAVFAEHPPVHNTRRWSRFDLHLPSGTVPAGATILVVLAAGADPDRAFGSGAHRCPARGLAPRIVQAGAADVWTRLRDPDALVVRGRRPSINVRITDLAEVTQ